MCDGWLNGFPLRAVECFRITNHIIHSRRRRRVPPAPWQAAVGKVQRKVLQVLAAFLCLKKSKMDNKCRGMGMQLVVLDTVR